jgi:hypothetical protein
MCGTAILAAKGGLSCEKFLLKRHGLRSTKIQAYMTSINDYLIVEANEPLLLLPGVW